VVFAKASFKTSLCYHSEPRSGEEPQTTRPFAPLRVTKRTNSHAASRVAEHQCSEARLRCQTSRISWISLRRSAPHREYGRDPSTTVPDIKRPPLSQRAGEQRLSWGWARSPEVVAVRAVIHRGEGKVLRLIGYLGGFCHNTSVRSRGACHAAPSKASRRWQSMRPCTWLRVTGFTVEPDVIW